MFEFLKGLFPKRYKGPKPLVPDFVPDPQMEELASRLVDINASLSYRSIYSGVGVVEAGNELEKFLGSSEGQSLRSYLNAYILLENSPLNSYEVRRDEYFRWYAGGVLRRFEKKK